MFFTRFEELAKEKGKTTTAIGKELGVSPSTMSYWRNNKSTSPKPDILAKLAEYFDVSVDYLLGNSKFRKTTVIEIDTGIITAAVLKDIKNTPIPEFIGKGVKIPVLGVVRAGIPIEAEENIIDYEEISQSMAATGEFFALQIKGDSMEPRITEGDVVIVRKQSSVDNGEIAVVLVNGNEATVKKFYKTDNGIKLISTNAKYDPFFFTPAEVNSLPVAVIGKVVELRAKF